MRVLIMITKSPVRGLLVKLHTEELVDEVKKLIDKKRHSQAMISALSKGKFERKVDRREIFETSADLILTEDAARWDVMRK